MSRARCNEAGQLLLAARDNLLSYSVATDPKYQPYAWHTLLARRLEAAVERGHGRFIIQAPPQHGKSRIVSQSLAAWALGKYPDRDVIAASYGIDLAERNGEAVRLMIENPVHRFIFPDSVMSIESTAKTNFRMTSGGRYFGTTVRGGATGFGARLFIIDDPFKSRDEADSKREREALKNWYRSVVYTRLNRQTVLVVMNTRWHMDDLSGWLLREHASENWELLSFPALAGEHDLLGRRPGQALCPERYNVAELNRSRIAVGSREWSALYQQSPVAGTGSEFKEEWVKRYEKPSIELGRSTNRYLLVDPSSGRGKNSDYTAMGVIGLGSDRNYYLLDGVRARLNLTERAKMLMYLHRKWKPRAVGYEQYGMQADIEHIRTVQEKDDYRFPITTLGGGIKKESRIRRLVPDFEAGRWWFPPSLVKRTGEEVIDVIDSFINDEYLTFPAGVHDDFIDMLARIYDMDQVFPKPRKIDTDAIDRVRDGDHNFVYA